MKGYNKLSPLDDLDIHLKPRWLFQESLEIHSPPDFASGI